MCQFRRRQRDVHHVRNRKVRGACRKEGICALFPCLGQGAIGASVKRVPRLCVSFDIRGYFPYYTVSLINHLACLLERLIDPFLEQLDLGDIGFSAASNCRLPKLTVKMKDCVIPC